MLARASDICFIVKSECFTMNVCFSENLDDPTLEIVQCVRCFSAKWLNSEKWDLS